MKKKLYLFSVLLIMLGALFQLNAQEDTIIFVAPYNAADPYGSANREVENIQFLERQGFVVQLFWPAKAINLVGQDTIDMLNAADLVIIGRSGPSTSFQQAADREVWNALTAPQMLICQWKARSSRLKWFYSTAAGHENTAPPIAYANVAIPGDSVFKNVTLAGDSMGWCYPPHDFIRVDSTINGDVLATWDGNGILLARFDAGAAFYAAAGDTAGGPRAYFGMGNDDTNDRYGNKFPNFFPLTKEAKKVYLAEICRLLGKPIQEPVWGAKDIHLTFVAPYDALAPYGSANREVENITFLEKQGYKVHLFWPLRAINLVGQDTIDMLNAADLVIIGRSGPSSSFQQAADREVWNALTAPQMLICQWKARSSRLKWFNSTAAGHENSAPPIAYADVAIPGDAVFDDVTLVGNSMGWCYPPHDFIRLADTITTNGDILATWDTTAILLARFDAGEAFYATAGDTAGGPRSYFGMGNDDTNDRYGKKFPNFFPLTREAKIVYLAEISRLVGVEAPAITYGAADYKITFIAPYNPTDITVNREIPQIKFLEKNGFKVKEFWPIRAINLTPQDSIDMLNAADLVIIGRSGPSTSFQQVADRKVWNSLTSPQMLICQWKARSSRLKWFNSTDAIHRDTSPATVYGKIPDKTDVVFSNVTLAGDSMQWFTPPPHDFIRLKDTTTVNGDILATFEDTIVLMARFDADVAFYPGSDTTGGPRSFFGMGNDNVTVGGKQFPNFFPLHDKAQQVYFNELCHLLNVGVSKVVTVSGDADLASITYDVAGTLTPAFHSDSMKYLLELDTNNVVNIDAVPNNAMATVVGDSIVTVTYLAPVTIYLVVTAENGVKQAYEVTIVPYNTSVKDIRANAPLKLYPNPAIDMLNISSENAINKVTIYNILGKVVIDETFRNNNHIQLNVSSLKPGLYLIKVGDGKDAVMGKFLIQ